MYQCPMVDCAWGTCLSTGRLCFGATVCPVVDCAIGACVSFNRLCFGGHVCPPVDSVRNQPSCSGIVLWGIYLSTDR